MEHMDPMEQTKQIKQSEETKQNNQKAQNLKNVIAICLMVGVVIVLIKMATTSIVTSIQKQTVDKIWDVELVLDTDEPYIRYTSDVRYLGYGIQHNTPSKEVIPDIYAIQKSKTGFSYYQYVDSTYTFFLTEEDYQPLMKYKRSK